MNISQIKYIITSKNRILCLKGWSRIDHLETKQIRLFIHPNQAKAYMEEGNYYISNYEIKKVIVEVKEYD